VKVKDIPIGRIARCENVVYGAGSLYVIHTYGFYFKLYPKTNTGKATMEHLKDYGMDLECELLPETTTVTLTFDGVHWDGLKND
jgi:hypothetical protein